MNQKKVIDIVNQQNRWRRKEGLNLIACNDDFYFDDVCGIYVSKLEGVALMGGGTYYIVIDGYGDDFGDYELSIIEYFPCILECPEGAILHPKMSTSSGPLASCQTARQPLALEANSTFSWFPGAGLKSGQIGVSGPTTGSTRMRS